MSSTMRTRICWSAMGLGFVDLGGYSGVARKPIGRVTGRSGPAGRRCGLPPDRARERARNDDLDDLRRQDSEVVDRALERDAGGDDRRAVEPGLGGLRRAVLG